MTNSNGSRLHDQAVGTDGETAALRHELERARQQADEAVRELDLLCYSVSHDLRAPLRAIDGFSEILQEDYESRLDEEGKRYLQIIRENTLKIEGHIETLLELARLGRRVMQRTALDMAALARGVLAELQIGEGHNLDVHCADLPAAVGDHEMIRQVFVELLSNAVKFSRSRAASVISIAGETDGGELIYCVKDNGVGFDMNYADKLFGVFQKLHSSVIFEGEGTGLAKVRRIISRHGGRVWAEGSIDQGATFYFTLPSTAT